MLGLPISCRISSIILSAFLMTQLARADGLSDAAVTSATVSAIVTNNLSEAQPLRLAGPPWQPFLSEQEPNTGMATEIVQTALRRAGYNTKVSIIPWRRVLAEARNASIDVLIGLWRSPERERMFLFSDPYYINQIHFLSVEGAEIKHFSNLEVFRGKRIGLRKGASYGHKFDSDLKLNKVFVPNSMSMLKMLVLERIDYGIGDRLILSGLIKADPELSKHIVFIEPALVSLPLHMAVVNARSDKEQIIQRFNAALADMKQKGEVDQIYERYYLD